MSPLKSKLRQYDFHLYEIYEKKVIIMPKILHTTIENTSDGKSLICPGAVMLEFNRLS